MDIITAKEAGQLSLRKYYKDHKKVIDNCMAAIQEAVSEGKRYLYYEAREKDVSDILIIFLDALGYTVTVVNYFDTSINIRWKYTV